jgi:hypothetical protein
VAKETHEHDGEGHSEVGFELPGTVRDGHGLYDEPGALRHVRGGGCRGVQEVIPKLVRFGAGDAGRYGEWLEPMA